MAELLADHTTFRVGGPARAWAEPETEAELIDLVSSADARGEPVLILGGGSNVLVADAGFDGTVIQLGRLRGVHTEDVAACSGAFIDVAAGEPWDAFVERSVHAGHVGVEALSGIPGLVGATPIQNVGAYGQEVSQTIARVRLWDRQDRKVVTRSVAECHFGYRRSLFKAQPGRWVVLSVSFQFRLGELSTPVRYAELAKALGIQPGERAPLAKVRRTVLQLRRGKGMVLDQADADTWSAGSFFTNPLVPAEIAAALPDDAPRYPQPDGTVKTSAAWLIEHAGFSRGYGLGLARLSSKHTLAITNRGSAQAADIVALAREVRAGVERAYGVRLVPEPVLIGVSLDA
ncbi:MAG TPA: UDP-N-acetylmuramate dehydrogenase [Propionicimonas sp.]|nr:UDP-N-acetylmuramate dehydrogenase [Propionicimonas sp.]HQA76799.1 UDP-N-acetylmuramate dehydrogenase [Propionicimonas sp.]HQD97795.1 UDP-N-acetylmuramate dehydrogenase [Propionicimonas sp.]